MAVVSDLESDLGRLERNQRHHRRTPDGVGIPLEVMTLALAIEQELVKDVPRFCPVFADQSECHKRLQKPRSSSDLQPAYCCPNRSDRACTFRAIIFTSGFLSYVSRR